MTKISEKNDNQENTDNILLDLSIPDDQEATNESVYETNEVENKAEEEVKLEINAEDLENLANNQDSLEKVLDNV